VPLESIRRASGQGVDGAAGGLELTLLTQFFFEQALSSIGCVSCVARAQARVVGGLRAPPSSVPH